MVDVARSARPEAIEGTAPPAPRAEIQALRAAAVLLVVIYHLWPLRLSGGYAGVDIFFVISGFLITAHLVREVDRTGTISLRSFWARRARRLLPASLLVLFLSAVAVAIWVPTAYWQQFLREIAAAASYFLNWLLASDAIDYLAAENLASPAQHYWSLSVEEQFYVVWPLLVLLGVTLAKTFRRKHLRISIFLVLAVVSVLSLGVSIYQTMFDPASAYFVTTTRAWEFGAGGLLAFMTTKPTARDWVRAFVAWLGWIAILATAMTFNEATPFPGYAALLPILGTAAVIWAGEPQNRWSPTVIVQLRPVQYLGDISYSIYLWHWPLIVILPFAIASELTTLGKIIILVVTTGLAAVTKICVEDPIRTGAVLAHRRPRFTFLLAGMSMAVVLVFCAVAFVTANVEQTKGTAQVEQLIRGNTECLGAAAFDQSTDPCVNPALEDVLLPELAGLYEDTGGAYACYDTKPKQEVMTCRLGSSRNDAVKIALVGDSHAAMLIPGIRDHLAELNWSVDTFVGRGCVWSAPTSIDRADECYERRNELQKRFETDEKYDYILVAARRDMRLESSSANPLAAEYARAWAPVIARGTKIIALADNPLIPQQALDCVIESDLEQKVRDCVVDRSEAFGTSDPLIRAVEIAGQGAHLVDLSDHYCLDDVCPIIIGHVIVYRDIHHITATFSRTLGPYLLNGMRAVIGSHGRT